MLYDFGFRNIPPISVYQSSIKTAKITFTVLQVSTVCSPRAISPNSCSKCFSRGPRSRAMACCASCLRWDVGDPGFSPLAFGKP